MATFVFKVSKFKSNKNQLRFSEYYQPIDGDVKALATMHLDLEFISGLPFCYLDDEGNKHFTFDRQEEFGDTKLNFNISFLSAHADKVMKAIKDNLQVFEKPTKDDNGVSLLRKWQMQVEIEESSMADLHKQKDGDFLTIYVESSSVKGMKLVSTKDKEYIHTPGQAKAKLDLVAKSIFKSSEDKDIKSPETLEETKNMILELTRAEKRAINRKKAKTAKAETNKAEIKKSFVITDDEEDTDDME